MVVYVLTSWDSRGFEILGVYECKKDAEKYKNLYRISGARTGDMVIETAFHPVLGEKK